MGNLSRRLTLQLVVIALARTILNIGIRMMYPFLPAFSRGLGVSISQLANIVALRNFVGIFSPAFGGLSERYGNRIILAGALGLFALSTLLTLLLPALWLFGAGLILMGFAKIIFDPPVQSFIGEGVPLEKRASAIALTELSWAAALLIGAPLAGWLIQQAGWQAPFTFLTISGIVAALALWHILPADAPVAAKPRQRLTRLLREQPIVWAAAFIGFCAMMAIELLFIIYGEWMENSFGLSLSSLGLTAALIGGSEILGELSVSAFAEKTGKKRFVLTVGGGMAVMFFLLPIISGALIGALVGLFLTFYCFESFIVGMIPLNAELVPTSRASVISVIIAATGLGRMVGSWIGPPLWDNAGIAGISFLSGMITLAGLVLLAKSIPEPTQ